MGDMFNKNKHVYVGVSACLLGQRVRYDGATKSHDFVADVLSRIFELEAICPEVEAGLGTPRPPVQLVVLEKEVKMLGVEDTFLDVTERINEYSILKVESLSHLRGYVFKARSPSCGLASRLSGALHAQTPGLFAKALMSKWPNMPVVEEGELDGVDGQKKFIQRVKDYAEQC